MPSKKQLGLYFGINSLSIVELERQKIIKFFDAPHSLFDLNQPTPTATLPESIKLTAILQKALRDNKIETTDTHLSLPSRDVIIRSFFIPWMTPSEIKGVVDFEARRYIPFKMEDLIYTVHPTTAVEKNKKRIRILFVAIKKETLDWYSNIVDQAGLKVTSVEPSVISLLRVLVLKKFIHQRQKAAVIETDQQQGAITIIEQGLPQFVRDFSLPSLAPNQAGFDLNALHTRLLSEIKVSFDYYRRNHTSAEIEKLVFVCATEAPGLIQSLGNDLKIPITALTPKSFYPGEEEIDIGSLHAFGSALRVSLPLPFSSNLAKGLTKTQESEKALEQPAVDYTATVKLALGSALVLLLTFLFANREASSYQQKLNHLQEQENVYKTLTAEDIRKKQAETLKKLAHYKTIRTKSDVTYFLNRIPEQLPKGVWLTHFTINYEDAPHREKTGKKTPAPATQITIDLAGYVYLKDVNRQVSQIKTLISNLRSEEDFLKLFDTITLQSVRKEIIDDNTVTSFQITCK